MEAFDHSETWMVVKLLNVELQADVNVLAGYVVTMDQIDLNLLVQRSIFKLLLIGAINQETPVGINDHWPHMISLYCGPRASFQQSQRRSRCGR